MARILVLEDRNDLRIILERMTVSLGHWCLSVATIGEALEIIVQEQIPMDLLVSDVGLPGETLWPFLRYIADYHPTMRILLISGTPKRELVRQGKIPDNIELLQKPFSLEEYKESLKRTLEAA